MHKTGLWCGASRTYIRKLERHKFQSAALAQLVEHSIRNAGVVGSSPTGGTTSDELHGSSSPVSRNAKRF